MRKFISVILALMLVLSTTVVAFNAYNVVDTDAPTIEDALVADEYDGSLAKVYFMMPNGKNGPVADDDVYVHHPEELDPDTGDVVKEAYDELVIEAGGKAPTWFNRRQPLCRYLLVGRSRFPRCMAGLQDGDRRR